MSEITREEKIEAEIKEAKIEKAKVETFLAEAIKINNEEMRKEERKRLDKIDDKIMMLLQHLENERQFQRNIATDSKVFILIN
jgi:hypothetical protein